ncbi:M67 family peptidase [Candidatus Thorarchaeota archaeon]|nr:MAG: M67 family peptidase [Candidatus Thorarchaeota archaeon]
MQYELHMTDQQLCSLVGHAERALPSECVALLFGRLHGALVKVESVRLVENVAEADSTSFFVDPEDQYELMMEEEAAKRAMVCIFHSHPAPAYPSSRDLRNMKLNPVIWLIASKITGSWKTDAFILIDGEITEVSVVLVDS